MLITNLSQYRLVSVQGDDAEKFLQGQLTCDVSKLQNGESTITSHCNPMGKITALFRIIRIEEKQFHLLIKEDILTFAINQLKKYAVFSKVEFYFLDWQITGLVSENINENCNMISAQIKIFLEGKPQRYILINSTPINLNYNLEPVHWTILEIQNGIPQFSAQSLAEFIPQAVNLQQIEKAISFQKGCYIGQETIARAKYRGINKRAMLTLQTDATTLNYTPSLGSEIEVKLQNGWRKTGYILSAVVFDKILWLQVIVNQDLQTETAFRLPKQHIGLKIYPLPYSLS